MANDLGRPKRPATPAQLAALEKGRLASAAARQSRREQLLLGGGPLPRSMQPPPPPDPVVWPPPAPAKRSLKVPMPRRPSMAGDRPETMRRSPPPPPPPLRGGELLRGGGELERRPPPLYRPRTVASPVFGIPEMPGGQSAQETPDKGKKKKKAKKERKSMAKLPPSEMSKQELVEALSKKKAPKKGNSKVEKELAKLQKNVERQRERKKENEGLVESVLIGTVGGVSGALADASDAGATVSDKVGAAPSTILGVGSIVGAMKVSGRKSRRRLFALGSGMLAAGLGLRLVAKAKSSNGFVGRLFDRVDNNAFALNEPEVVEAP
jgi:hypothetical protein